MLPTALVPSWKVGVVSVALHTQHAQQSSCFGNLPRERGLIITWITPTSFTPLSIGSYWTASIGKKKVQLALSFWIRLWIINVGKFELETFCSQCLYLLIMLLPVLCPVLQMIFKNFSMIKFSETFNNGKHPPD